MDIHPIQPGDRRSWGLALLASIDTAAANSVLWKHFLEHYAVSNRRDELNGWLTCVLALQAVSRGNFGVGAVLADGNDRLLSWGHNEIFAPRFASDRHAEMVVMDHFEESPTHPDYANTLRLFTSLECCPMCLTRLISSGVGTVLHLAEDADGGMTHKMDELPVAWRQVSGGQTFRQADCTPSLTDAALNIFLLNADTLYAKLIARGESNL